MKNKFSLSIAKPCLERWEHFTPTSQGGICHSCNKNVTDFTTMSDEEIIAFFKNKPAQSCGRFGSHQLKVYSPAPVPTTPSHRYFLQAGLLSLFMLLGTKQGYPKNISQKTATHFIQSEDNTPINSSGKLGKVVKGIVKDEYDQPLPGVNIYLKGSTVGTTTDASGSFTFPQAVEVGDILQFSFIGFETKEHVVKREASSLIQIVLITLYMDIMGEVAMDMPYTTKPTGMSKWWQQVKSLF